MKPDEFIKSVYLGDRCLKSISISLWESRVELQVDLISRVRSPSGSWDFYSGEDIKDGKIVVSGVQSFQFIPSGPMPNDVIDSLKAHLRPDGRYDITITVESVQPDGQATLVEIVFNATAVHLESPERPGLPITN